MRKIIVVLLVLCAKIAQAQIYIDSYRFAAQQTGVQVEYLVVGGGGGGGSAIGGGGGAGGYRTGTINDLITLTNYTVTVGLGGTGGVNVTYGSNGSSSTFNTITSAGGGGGANGATVPAANGLNGGSGGGGGGSSTRANSGGLGNTPNVSPSQGNNGGNSSISALNYGAGGGGGAGATGSNGTGTTGGNGGIGVENFITGTGVYYAGGGGGGTYLSGTAGVGGNGGGGSGTTNNNTASNALPNTGGGGGGGGWTSSPGGNGGNGGSGVVILRYPNSYSIITTSGNLEVETSFVGTDKVTTFKSGSGEIQFVEESIPNIVTDNLIAWYDASVVESYPGTGTTWFDLSGNNYDLTLTNASQYENVNGGVIDFENELASRTGVINTQVHTVSMWFKSDNSFSDTPVQYGLIDINSDQAVIHLSSSTGGVSGEDITIFNLNPTYGRTMATGAPSLANTWYYLTLTFDGSKYLIYVNGVLYSTTSGADPNASVIKNLTNLKVGSRDTYNYDFYGKIGELYFYSDRLTTEEILLNYNATKTRYGY